MPGMSGRPRTSAPQRRASAPGASRIDSSAPAQGPRLARRLQIRPDGTVAWRLERSIPGGTAGDSNLYALRVDARRLRAQAPSRATRIRRNTNEDPRAFRERRQQAIAEQRERQRDYEELRREVGGLPDEFEAPMPTRLWAVFELPTTARQLNIEGVQPAGWSIEMRDLEALLDARPIGGGQAGQIARLTGEGRAMVQSFTRVLGADQHPYTARAVAVAFAQAALGQHLVSLEPPYPLAEALVRHEDVLTRRLTVEQLLETVPPTPPIAALLRQATRDPDPQIRMQALRGILHGGAGSQTELAHLVDEANRLLADSPTPRMVLEELLAIDPSLTYLHQALTTRIRFDALQGERRVAAIALVLSAATEEPLAAAWLDHQLLGATDPALVRQTLELLNAASAGGSVIEPVLVQLLDHWLGEPAAATSAAAAEVVLGGPIAITTPMHNFFRVLQSGAPEIRELGWHALRHFELLDVPAQAPAGRDRRRGRNRGRTAPATAPVVDTYTVLVDTALSRSTTPMQTSQAAEFLARQQDNTRATFGLVRLTLSPSVEAAGRAARILIGSGRPIEQALNELGFEDRQVFANAVYQARGTTPPLVTALMAHPVDNNRVVPWFGALVATGVVPELSEWADAFGGEDDLLDLVQAGDPTMALAAVAALVFVEGGDEAKARAITDQMLSGGGKARQERLSEWQEHQRSLRRERLQAAEGTYRLVLNVYAGQNAAGRPGGRPTPFRQGRGPNRPMAEPGRLMMPGGPGMGPGGGRPRFRGTARTVDPQSFGERQSSLSLGTVTLEVNDDSISFGTDSIELSLPDSHLAIRLADPQELSNLSNAEVAELPLESIGGSIDLLATADGRWRGSALLADGRVVELVMAPVKAEADGGAP